MFTNCHTHYSVSEKYEIKQESPDSAFPYFHSVGVHPRNAADFSENETISLLRRTINSQTLAIGECGLDALKGPDFSVQIPVFEKQIELSEELELPLIIHCVKAWNELYGLRKKHKPDQPWVFHGFSKSGILNHVVRSGMMISLGAGILKHPKREEIVKNIPRHQLLLETDDVQMEIKQVYECVAGLKKISLQELKDQVNTNFKNTFRKWQIG